MDKDEAKGLLTKILKKGAYLFIIFLGIILIYLGLVGKAKIPAAYYTGGFIVVIGIVIYIFEFVIRMKKINKAIEAVSKLEPVKTKVVKGCNCE